MGVEPTTPGTTIRCSAIELRPPQRKNQVIKGIKVARQKGFEPLTRSLEGCCSILLSYWRRSLVAAQGFEPRTCGL